MKKKRKIILISCCSTKLNTTKEVKAEDLYISSVFKKSLEYAKLSKPYKIFIISAKYGLLNLDEPIKTYNVTLSYVPQKNRNQNLIILSKQEKKEWAKKVVKQLKENDIVINNDDIEILAGQSYIKPLAPYITKRMEPLNGIGNGARLSFLNSLIKNLQQ